MEAGRKRERESKKESWPPGRVKQRNIAATFVKRRRGVRGGIFRVLPDCRDILAKRSLLETARSSTALVLVLVLVLVAPFGIRQQILARRIMQTKTETIDEMKIRILIRHRLRFSAEMGKNEEEEEEEKGELNRP